MMCLNHIGLSVTFSDIKINQHSVLMLTSKTVGNKLRSMFYGVPVKCLLAEFLDLTVDMFQLHGTTKMSKQYITCIDNHRSTEH